MVRTIDQHPIYLFFLFWVRRGRDRMVHVVEFTTTSCHFQQYFSYIIATSFIGGENRRPSTSH
jgi:hypothetical protein